jgi:hypothetical protein
VTAPAQQTFSGGEWTRRFVIGPARLAEYVDFYRSLGFEVRLEPVPPAELLEQCSDCALALTFFKVIYTRRPS